jgi:ribonucleoside-diphosphate reductase beta chain
MTQLSSKSNERFFLFPIQHDDIWKMYKQALASFWVSEEIDLSSDITDWNHKLTEDERNFIKLILAFFANSDAIVSENLCLKFYNDTDVAEAKAFYSMQILIEQIHAETYNVLIDSYIKNEEEKFKLFTALDHYDCIKQKGDFMLKYIYNNADYNKRLVAFVIVEGLFFSSSFASIFWLKKRNLLKGLCFSNELISRDEGLHTNFGILLYSKLQNKLTEQEIYTLFKEAIDIELNFINDALDVSLIGMNKQLMTEYIYFVADYLLSRLGYNKLYDVKNPFPFMEMISLSSKNNFFEVKVGEYQKAGVMSSREEMTFKTDEDF